MPQVNPAIMVWARETAGLSQEEAAKKLGLRDSPRSSAVEKLAFIERGQKEPSRPQLLKMAGQYRRPLLTFYLSRPPRKSNRGADFRTLPQNEHAPEEALLDALIREIRARQSMVRVIMEDEDEAEPLPFVGSHRIEDGPAVLLESLQALLGLNATVYRAQLNESAAFALLRRSAEEAGIFVLLKGNLGNYKTALDTTVFRGFAIADEVAPFIVINDQDAKSAWSFTLLHETVHLLLGHTGISGESAENEIERFCNDVAGEFLLPSKDLARPTFDDRNDIDVITAKISEQDGGSSYYRTRRHRLGSRIIGLVKRMMAADALSTSKAAQILGVKPRQVQLLLDTGSSR